MDIYHNTLVFNKLRIRAKILIMQILRIAFCIIPHRKVNEQKILVLSYFNLGDVICDIPSLRALKLQWPNAKIHLLMRRPTGVNMMSTCPYVDSAEIITSDLDNWKSYFKQLYHLKRMNFDMSFQLVRPFAQYRKTNIPYLIGIPKRYGIIDKKDEKLYQHCFTKYTYVQGKTSRKEESIRIIELSGLKVVDTNTECWIPPKIDDLYAQSKQPFVVIHPGASLEYKCWPKEKFIQLINYIDYKYNCPIYVTGTSSENELLLEIKNSVSERINFMNNIPIFEFWALLKHSFLVITNDTGTLHFSIALKRNVISIFGPTYPDYAIGSEIPQNCVVIRGTTHKCSFKNCDIYTQLTPKRKQQIFRFCQNSNTVCTDMIPFTIVQYFVDIFFSGDLSPLKYIRNLQGYNPFRVDI